MLATNQQAFMNLFNELEDPREDERTTYPLNEIVFLMVAAVLSGAESWRNIIHYGIKKLELLRQFLPYLNGIPSRYTLMRFMSVLDKNKFGLFLSRWARGFIDTLQDELIAIDGKALKGARKHAPEKNALYLLNAFATKQGVVIAQKAIEEKTNEITAIPALIDELNVCGATVSIDAIGCQKNIAEKEERRYYISNTNSHAKPGVVHEHSLN